tara:strand:- start:34818 stop:35753 length:936 start_codon:yes stop_codon:yes gene_type:complete
MSAGIRYRINTVSAVGQAQELEVALQHGATAVVRRMGNLGGLRVFLSHGNGFAIDGYRRFWEPWLDRFELILFDQRNHGRSPPSAAEHHTYPQLARDLQTIHSAVSRRFGVAASVGVFHSLSARAAMLHRKTSGSLWDALVLVDPPSHPPAGASREAMLTLDSRLLAWAESRQERFADPAELADYLRNTRAHAQWEAGVHDEMAQAVLRKDGEGWALCCPGAIEAIVYRSNPALDVWPSTADDGAGVLLLSADPQRTHASPTAVANVELAAAGGYEYCSVPDTGHLLQLEKPAACREAIEAFLARQGLITG